MLRSPDILHRLGAGLRAAWRLNDVRRGLAGTFCITLGALSPAYLPYSSPLWRWLTALHATGPVWRISGTVLTMLGALLLVDAWFRLRPVELAAPLTTTGSPRDGRLRRWWASLNGPDAPPHSFTAHLACPGWAVLFWWVLPLLFAPPVFSRDAYSYAAQGWILHNGIDPYAVGPGSLPGGFADQVDWVWRMTPAPYGPLSLRISEWLVEACHYWPYLSAWAQRLPALLGVLLIGLLLPRIARRMGMNEHFTTWFALLNPMLVISFVGGAHNDALMMGFVVVGIWLAGLGRRSLVSSDSGPGPAAGVSRDDKATNQNDGQGGPAPAWGSWWWLAGAVAVGVGAAIKQPALLAAYALPLIARPWASWQWRETLVTVARVLLSFATAIGTFCLVTLATGLGFGWLNAVGVPGLRITLAPSTLIGLATQQVASWFGVSLAQDQVLAAAHFCGLLVGATLLTFLALTLARRKPVAFLAWGYLTAAITGPALHTWYVQWSLTLFPLTRLNAVLVRVSVWGTLAMLGFDAIIMARRNSAWAVAAGALLVIVWLAWGHLRAHDAAAGRGQAVDWVESEA